MLHETTAAKNSNVSTVSRAELLGQLDPDNLDLFKELIEELEQPDADPEQIKTWFEFESARRNRAKSHQKPAPATPATEQAESPTNEAKAAPDREDDPEKIESVHTIARFVFARMLTNEIGSALFPLGLSHLGQHYDEVGGLYDDIVEGIISGLAGCDMDELQLASCLGSVR